MNYKVLLNALNPLSFWGIICMTDWGAGYVRSYPDESVRF